MAKKIHYDVILTPSAREIISKEPINRFLIEGRKFNCIEINPASPYFFMKIEEEDPDLGKVIMEIYIPHHLILYYISVEANPHHGF